MSNDYTYSLDDITSVMCHTTKIKRAMFLGCRKDLHLIEIRQVFAIIACQHYGYSQAAVAKHLNRERSTITHSVRRPMTVSIKGLLDCVLSQLSGDASVAVPDRFALPPSEMLDRTLPNTPPEITRIPLIRKQKPAQPKRVKPAKAQKFTLENHPPPHYSPERRACHPDDPRWPNPAPKDTTGAIPDDLPTDRLLDRQLERELSRERRLRKEKQWAEVTDFVHRHYGRISRDAITKRLMGRYDFVTDYTVEGIVKRDNLCTRPDDYGFSEDQKSYILENYRSMSYLEMAKHLGVTRNKVGGWCNRNKLYKKPSVPSNSNSSKVQEYRSHG